MILSYPSGAFELAYRNEQTIVESMSIKMGPHGTAHGNEREVIESVCKFPHEQQIAPGDDLSETCRRFQRGCDYIL